MGKLRFRGVIEMSGINPFVSVSAERAARIQKDWRKPLPVLVRVNGKPEKPWRINMMPVGGGEKPPPAAVTTAPPTAAPQAAAAW